MPMEATKFHQFCVCSNPPFLATNYNIQMVGIDCTAGRFGEVRIMQCKICGNFWIEYFYENEAFSESGRWFKGRISETHAKTILPEEAVAYLAQLDGYFYGGSYFRTNGKWGHGELHL